MRESNTYTNFKYQINKNIRKPPKCYMLVTDSLKYNIHVLQFPEPSSVFLKYS